MADNVCNYCGAPLREVVDGACPFCRVPVGSPDTALAGAVAPGAGAVAIVLEDAGGKKIQVIKVLRELTGYGLAEAKQLVDAADQGPVVIAAGLDEQLASTWLEHLGHAGARVSRRPG